LRVSPYSKTAGLIDYKIPKKMGVARSQGEGGVFVAREQGEANAGGLDARIGFLESLSPIETHQFH